jgi:hypothetical protein
MDAKLARRLTDFRKHAIEARDKWLTELRENAGKYPSNLDAQLLLAEAECRTAHYAECIAVSDRALAVQADSSPALAWKGLAMAELAIAGPASGRPAALRAARAVISRANRADTEAVLPLLAYFRSFTDAGETPPPAALAGVLKVTDSIPAAPGPRLLLGAELAREGKKDAARKMLLPVANAGYDSPERDKARALLGERRE